MPVDAGLVSSPSKYASREFPASLSRVLRRAEDGLLAALVPLTGDPVLDPALNPAALDPALVPEVGLVSALLILLLLFSRNILISII